MRAPTGPAKRSHSRPRSGQAGFLRGRRAETLCVWALRLGGWHILERNWRGGPRGSGLGEVDIIARRGKTLAFIEVKARSETTAGLEALSPQQRQRQARAAETYIHRHALTAEIHPRFDLMVVKPWRWPIHVKNAWNISWPTGS